MLSHDLAGRDGSKYEAEEDGGDEGRDLDVVLRDLAGRDGIKYEAEGDGCDRGVVSCDLAGRENQSLHACDAAPLVAAVPGVTVPINTVG